MSDPAQRPEPHPQSAPPHWLELAAAWSWRLVALAAALYVALRVAAALWVALLPVVLGAIFASLLAPVALRLRAWHLPRALAGTLAMLLGLGVLAGIGSVVGFGVAREFDALAASLEQGYLQAITFSTQTIGVSPEEVRGFLEEHMQSLQASVGGMVKGVASQVPRVVQGLAVAALTFVFTWFFTWDGDRQFEAAVQVLPAARRPHARALGERVWAAVGGYMRGMLVVAAADAVLLGLGLWAIGLKLVLPLMMLMFVSAFVPFVGPVLTGAMACLVALGSGDVTSVGLVILVAIAVQQVEGNLLSPFVMAHAVKLHPALVLLAITAGGSLGGVLGVFLAIPVAASVTSVFDYLRR